MKIVALSQLVSRGMRYMVMKFVAHRSNNRLRVWTGQVDSLLFQLQASSSEGTTSNTPIFFAWVIRNQLLWMLFTLSVLWGGRKRFKQCQSSQGSLAYWALVDCFLTSKGSNSWRLVFLWVVCLTYIRY